MRQEKGLSQERLAKAARIAPNTVLKAERGEPVSYTTIRALCEALRCDFNVLIEQDEATLKRKTLELPEDLEDVTIVLPFDHDTHPNIVIEYVKELMRKLEIERTEVTNGRLGSVHLTLRLKPEDAEKMRRAFPMNADWELDVMDAYASSDPDRSNEFGAPKESSIEVLCVTCGQRIPVETDRESVRCEKCIAAFAADEAPLSVRHCNRKRRRKNDQFIVYAFMFFSVALNAILGTGSLSISPSPSGGTHPKEITVSVEDPIEKVHATRQQNAIH